MSRYIDADALMAELQKDADAFDDEADDARKNSQNYTDGDLYSVMGRADGIRDAMMEVYDAPSIDIVRCKACKHNYNTTINHGKMQPRCDFADWKLTENDYCSRGERKEK